MPKVRAYKDHEMAGVLSVTSLLLDAVLDAKLVHPSRLDRSLGDLREAYEKRGQPNAARTVEWLRRSIGARATPSARGLQDLPPAGRA